jgi:RimJ/RimL family protein N-acetyltransferase
VIETERLVLRQWREADRAPWRAMNADAQVMRFFPAVLADAEADRQMDWCRDRLEAGILAFWAVERKADGAFLGFIGVSCIGHDIPLKGQWETGWRLARRAWGQGYAQEGARASLAHGFAVLRVPRIVAYTASTNLPSMAVMQRIGMVPAPEEDFDHAAIPEGHALRRHVVWEARP